MSETGSDEELINSNDSDTEEQNDDEDVTDQERQKIRDQLSTMSFEDLQKLKNEMGSKLYNQTLFGKNKTKPGTSFKRANKNRPREVSSKKRVKLENNIIPVKKQRPRDPRFDPLCGAFDLKSFKDNYKFVNDLRKKEKVQLEKQLKDATDPEEKKKMKFVIQRLENQIREQEKKEKLELEMNEEKKEVREKLKRGERVQFKKKSVKKLENLINKYEELKKTNKLQKHIEKRTKKLSVKERKKLEREKLIT